MPRGIVPRQPSKTGRQDKSRSAHIVKTKVKAEKTSARKRSKAGQAQKPASPKRSAGSLRGYNPVDPERVAEIQRRLDELYPDATCALTHNDPWELLVSTILSAQSTDANVNRVTPELFRKYPSVKDFAAITPEQLEPLIYSTGFFRNKAKSIVGAAKKIVTEFGGEIPDEMDKLLTLPGVARKTANVLLGTWFRQGVGIVVDTHVTRLSRRLELTKNTEPTKIEQDLMKVIPADKWILFAHQLIWHGRKLCIARNPKCVECPLENICHAGDKTWSTVDMHKAAQ